MKDYKVWFNDAETMKNHSIKVKANGLIEAINESKEKMYDKYGIKSLEWDIWKAEMM